MPDPVQKDRDRLVDALSSLLMAHNTASQHGRELLSQGNMDPLDAVRCEVNRTILRRVLVFLNNRKETLSVEVADRRILRLILADGVALDLSPGETGATRRAASAILAFCSDSKALSVVSKFSRTALHPSVIGLPIDALNFTDASQHDPLQLLQEQSDSIRDLGISCVVFAKGAVQQSWGSEEMVDRLIVCAQAHPDMPPTTTIWGDPSEDGMCIGVARHGDACLWMVALNESLPEICKAWSAFVD